MMDNAGREIDSATKLLHHHKKLTRRYFLRLGAAGTAMSALLPFAKGDQNSGDLAAAIEKLEPFFTKQNDFQDVSRGKPIPHTLPEERMRAVGLTRDSWKLEVVSDLEHPARIRRPFTAAKGTSFDFPMLMGMAEKHAVRFAKVMTCLNIGCPLGMGIWEGVPLRDLIWQTRPGDNVRRVFYYGYHNDDPKQMFRSSLPIGRVLEDPFDLPPVILCYKLNGEWLTSERGGPVRIVVPEAYGFKSIKWLSHVVLTNLPHANDTYAEQGNDVDSPLKSFAATLSFPREISADVPIPITGYAQVGIGGLSKVQAWIQRDDAATNIGGPYLQNAPWQDAEVLGPPEHWGGDLPGDAIPANTHGFDDTGRPRNWPMRLGKVHWAILHPGLPAGEYTLRCRAVDAQGIGQPLPRPFRKSGHAAIEKVSLVIT